MRSPLSVRINDSIVDRLVPRRKANGLRFTKTAPGGHHSASVRIDLPREDFTRLGPADLLDITDTRTGRIIWSGYTDNPGSTDGTSGQFFELSAMGSTVLASDESRALVYIDRDLSNWDKGSATAASAQAQVSADPLGAAPDGLLLQFVPGQPITTNYNAVMYYLGLSGFGHSDMEFGSITVTIKSGKADAGYRDQLIYHDGASYLSVPLVNSSTITLGPTTNTRQVDGGAGFPPSPVYRVGLRLLRAGGSTTVADDLTWSLFYDICITARRMDRDGTLRPGSDHTPLYVIASDVAEDLLGRLLTMCDPTTAVIEATTGQIDQLAYLDGATAAQVFDDLALHEPDSYFGIGARRQNGKHEFWYRAWSTDPRYEISTKDGYSAPGSDFDLCNRIAVFWTDEKGNKRTTIRTATVEALGTRTRDAESITLPDGLGSQTNAERIGDAVLAAKADPPKAATATVRRPLIDLWTGDLVMPWEIEPGYLVRVRETGDLLRLTEMEYVDDDVAATLTLGEPVLSIDQRIARLAKKR